MRLSKYHGLGNDFLVLVDLAGEHAGAVDGALARRLCDRHRGIGADGLIRVSRSDGNDENTADVAMRLWNADGSRAEMSGNGIRCLAHAVIDSGVDPGPILTVATEAGIKTLTRQSSDQPGVMRFSVDMGQAAALGGLWVTVVGRKVAGVDMGNPHAVVLVDDPAEEDFAELAGRVNVEAVAPGPEPEAITMRVWERGVGETLACGTGAAAAAWAASREWGLVGDHVVVHQPGGAAEVDLTHDGKVTLTGPSEFIATVEVSTA